MSISNGKLSKKLNCYDFYNENISARPQNTQTKQHNTLNRKDSWNAAMIPSTLIKFVSP
jgi:hypothetical protein